MMWKIQIKFNIPAGIMEKNNLDYNLIALVFYWCNYFYFSLFESDNEGDELHLIDLVKKVEETFEMKIEEVSVNTP